MTNKIKTRLASEQGFTLIELLVVIIILGILVAIAVPAYLSFRGNAQDAAAKSNVRSAIPAAESYYQATNDSYTGMDNAALKLQAPGVSGNVAVLVLNNGQGYCLDDQLEGNNSYYYVGGTPGATSLTVGQITQGKCS
jgi:type IV pilus assembly protein PilA